MAMQLLSVNIGQKRTQQKGNELETTGIYKLPVQEPVEIKSLGISTDSHLRPEESWRAGPSHLCLWNA